MRKNQNEIVEPAELKEAEHGHKHRIHPLEEGAIDVHRWRKGILAGEINFKILEEVSNNHSIWEIPNRNHQLIRKHEVNQKLGDINSNAFQKAIDEQRCTTLSVTKPARHRKEIEQNVLS